jgi:pimeloyl-ACP methyl ester carboxylesterase
MAGACGSASSGGADTADSSSLERPARLAFVHDRTDVTKLQWAEPFSVRVSGLTAGQAVTLQAKANVNGALQASRATFAASATGEVDTSSAAPSSGDYDGVDIDGLAWSMRPSSDPLGDLAPFAFRVQALAKDGKELASATLSRFVVRDGVTRTVVSDNGLDGVFYADPTLGKRPCIVAFGGSEGGLTSGDRIASFWASRGYAALGLAYFADKSLPPSLDRIPLEYFERAFAWLDTRKEADATRLAVIGGSRGGELALLLGSTFPRISAVVAQVPSAVSWGAPSFVGDETPSWTYQGNGVPFLPYRFDIPYGHWKTPDGKIALAARPQFEAALHTATPAALEAATFAVEKTNGPILMVGGADDQIWPSCTLGRIAMDRLNATGHASKHADAFVCYPNAGHAVSLLPGSPTLPQVAQEHPITHEFLALGGTLRGLAHGQRDFFGRVDHFLAAALGAK